MPKGYLVQSNVDEEETTEATAGYDPEAGATWIYPTNYPIRDYQFNIVKECLFKNTLVTLPTGLGKTFIAAVVMYNFFRWYPQGKIIFLAPTRPLVKQQVDACYNITAIPKDTTTELTGSKAQMSREKLWKEKRVIFATPQVLQNDLDVMLDLATSIKCIVFDEAHRAKGNHAYCKVIEKLTTKNRYFRVLALSATPGNSLNDVTEIIRNLLISHIEYRNEESPDVQPYVHERSLETIVVPLEDKLQQVRDEYIKVLEVYTRVLMTYKVIQGNCSMLTKGKIFMTMKDFQEKNRTHTRYSEIMKNLNICITLYHAYELLIRHGLRGFLSFCDEHANKPLLRSNANLHQIMEDVRDFLGPALNLNPLPDGNVPDIPADTKFGHPKFYKLKEVLLEHFNSTHEDSRVIIFFEYRESVMEAYALLLQNRPKIKARLFLGQGSMTQRQQINIISSFRVGECNTLLSTCIGEEGLDVGEVNLIICFDISNKSPIRMVQRMGRTGRRTKGRVVILVTEGREQQTLNDCLQQKNNFSKHILMSMNLNKHIFVPSCRMVPNVINPECVKMFITVAGSEETKNKKIGGKTKAKTNSVKRMFEKINAMSEACGSQDSSKVATQDLINRIPELNRENHWNQSVDEIKNSFVHEKAKCNFFAKHLEKSRKLQKSTIVQHSLQSEMLVSILEHADLKRYNLPITQVAKLQANDSNRNFNKNSNRNNKILSGDNFIQSDIRSMFFKVKTLEEPMKKSELEDIKLDFEDEPKLLNLSPRKEDFYEFDRNLFNELNTEITSYLTIKLEDSYCRICDNLFKCMELKHFYDKNASICLNPIQVDFASVENLNKNNLERFITNLKSSDGMTERKIIRSRCDDLVDVNFMDVDVISFVEVNKSNVDDTLNEQITDNNVLNSPVLTQKNYYNRNRAIRVKNSQNKSLDEDSSLNYKEVLLFFKLNFLSDLFSEAKSDLFSEEKSDLFSEEKSIDNVKIKPKIIEESIIINNSPEDIFASNSPKENIFKNTQEENIFQNTQEKNLIKNSISSNDSICYSPLSVKTLNATRSPVGILNSGQKSDFEETSPILCSYDKVKEFKRRVNCRKSLFNASMEESNTKKIIEEDSKIDNTNEVMNKLNLLNETLDLKALSQQIEDVCDLSAFNLDSFYTPKKQMEKQSTTTGKLLKTPEKQSKSIEKQSNSPRKQLTTTGKQLKIPEEQLKSIEKQSNTLRKQLTTTGKQLKTPEKQLKSIEKQSNTPIKQLTSTKKQLTTTKKQSTTLEKQSITPEKQSVTPEKQSKTQDCSNIFETSLKELNELYDICDLSLFGFDFNQPMSPTVGSVNKLSHKLEKSIKKSIPSQKSTQVTVTQALQLVTKESQNKRAEPSSSDYFEDDSFNFDNSAFEENILKHSDVLNFNSSGDKITENTERTFKIPTVMKTPTLKCKNRNVNLHCISNQTPKLNKSLNESFNAREYFDDDDDDDFEPTTSFNKTCKPFLTTRKPPKSQESPTLGSKFRKPKAKSDKQNLHPNCRKRKMLKASDFLDLEAELSEGEAVSEDERDSDDDVFEGSFVDDCTQMNNTNIQAHYLQSIRSPRVNQGKFKIPRRPGVRADINVYSQEVEPDPHETYLDDSFVVHTESFLHEEQEEELSELELAELKLKEERRKRKRSKNKENLEEEKPAKAAKRKRIIYVISSDESE